MSQYSTFFILCILVVAVRLWADPGLNYAPDRYLDGKALANFVTPWIFENTPAQSRLDTEVILTQDLRLVLGASFPADEHREDMRQWMLAQTDYSIRPHQLFQKALELEGGNVDRALQLCWNILSEEWRGINSRTRNKYPHTVKLYDITGELSVHEGDSAKINDKRGKTIRGDNFSAWYHFFGTALRTYRAAMPALRTTSRLSSSDRCRRDNFSIHIELGKDVTGALVFLEERVLFNEFRDPLKRRAINAAGIEFGSQLAANLTFNRDSEQFRLKNPKFDAPYIYDNPDVYGPKWRLAPGQRPSEWVPPE